MQQTRKQESSSLKLFNLYYFWIPVYTGMTTRDFFLFLLKKCNIYSFQYKLIFTEFQGKKILGVSDIGTWYPLLEVMKLISWSRITCLNLAICFNLMFVLIFSSISMGDL